MDVAAEALLVLNVSGTWIGRRPEDATDEDARRHIRSKAFRTGQEMRQIQLGLPGGVGGGTVTVPIVPTGGTQPGAGPILTPDAHPKPGMTGEEGGADFPPVEGGDQTGGESEGSTPVVESPEPTPLPPVKIRRTEEPATGINLSGSFESWGVASSQSIEKTRIEFSGLNTQQVKQILQRIPSAFKASLEIEYKEGGE